MDLGEESFLKHPPVCSRSVFVVFIRSVVESFHLTVVTDSHVLTFTRSLVLRRYWGWFSFFLRDPAILFLLFSILSIFWVPSSFSCEDCGLGMDYMLVWRNGCTMSMHHNFFHLAS